MCVGEFRRNDDSIVHACVYSALRRMVEGRKERRKAKRARTRRKRERRRRERKAKEVM